jgi:hypothetical protein
VDVQILGYRFLVGFCNEGTERLLVQEVMTMGHLINSLSVALTANILAPLATRRCMETDLLAQGV